jgi:hypothetical protein
VAEPSYFVAGDTVTWTKAVSGYPATAGWTLEYYFWNATADYSVEAAADGSDYEITIAAAVSAEYAPGRYQWRAVVSKAGERYAVASGEIEIRHDPASGDGTGIDDRSQVKVALDAIEAVLAGRASKDQESYTINNRSLNRTPIADLILLRNHYRREYAREQREKRIAEGLGGGGKMLIRFR